MTIALQLQAICTASSPPVRPLQDLTLSVHAAEVLGLLGPPGSGKSTLLRLMAGTVHPESGQVVAQGPPPILLDEPLKEIGSPDGRHLMAAIRQWTAVEGRAVVLATPHTAVAHAFCDRVALLGAGRLLVERPSADFAPFLLDERYQIRVRGELDQRMARWFDGFQLEQGARGETALIGSVPDQSALRAVLTRIFDLGLTLLDVTRLEPDLTPLYR